MAKPSARRSENVPGPFYVDESCIDCDTCRWMAPEVFHSAGSMSAVHAQPADEEQELRAFQALVSCPTSSIGCEQKLPVSEMARSLPIPVDEHVFHCGYHHESSFGAASYLIRRPEGNVLVDSPRFASQLVRRLEELGGVRTLWLSHRDDVGDHAKFAAHFGCERILHEDDADGELRAVERLLSGQEPVALDDELCVVPVPGHTRGSCVLLWRGTHAFTGDHLAWSDELERIYAFRRACWYDWEVQIESMRRLSEHAFEWVLPGHGRRCRFPAGEMRTRMADCVQWMRSVA